uniref:Uncharacterized protein n=1 Tax=Romanomermis culicivorax TaxID=13658 RepID=A0A915I1Y6_ROMCU
MAASDALVILAAASVRVAGKAGIEVGAGNWNINGTMAETATKMTICLDSSTKPESTVNGAFSIFFPDSGEVQVGAFSNH